MKSIGLLGSFGTGKSTVFELLKKERPQYRFFGESIRYQMDAFGQLDRVHELIGEVGIGPFQLLNVNTLSTIDPQTNPLLAEDDTLVVDQISIGHYGYYLSLREKEIDFELEPLLKSMCQHYASLIDYVIYFPLGVIPLVSDDLRKQDEAMQKKVDKGIQQAISELGISDEKIHALHSNTAEKRVKEILTLVEE